MRTIQGVLLALCALGALGASLFPQEFDDEWDAWKVGFGKTYASEKEEVMRRLTWQKNLELVVKHNMEHQRGVHSYRLGMNQFADMENEEFVAFFNGFRKSNASKQGSTFLAPENIQLPDSVDWRPKGYVTPVKDQMQCGSCWAFSATGSLEGQTFAKTGKLVSLSEQNLVDCSGSEGNEGCNGGLMDQAFQYVMDNSGIDTEDSYPYQGVDQRCAFKKSSIGATCTGYTDVMSESEQALKKAVATVGPISVAIDASHMSFQLYESGVYDEPECSSSELDHGVLAVGYDTTTDGTDYWIVKNSWNTSWGNKGYIWMSRNKNNQCGIATQASYPLV